MRIIKPKNLKRYKEEFSIVSDDSYERLVDYLSAHPLKDKERLRLADRIKEITNIDMNYLKIILDIIPEPTPRPRLSGKIFYVKNSRTNNEFVRLMVKNDEDMYHFITTPCEFVVKTYFPIPKNFNREDTILAELGLIEMISRPDWDNLGKTYSDMIQKWILADDSLIIDGRSIKAYSLKPRVEILIKYKLEHSCKHNKKLMENAKSVTESPRK